MCNSRMLQHCRLRTGWLLAIWLLSAFDRMLRVAIYSPFAQAATSEWLDHRRENSLSHRLIAVANRINTVGKLKIITHTVINRGTSGRDKQNI